MRIVMNLEIFSDGKILVRKFGATNGFRFFFLSDGEALMKFSDKVLKSIIAIYIYIDFSRASQTFVFPRIRPFHRTNLASEVLRNPLNQAATRNRKPKQSQPRFDDPLFFFRLTMPSKISIVEERSFRDEARPRKLFSSSL